MNRKAFLIAWMAGWLLAGSSSSGQDGGFPYLNALGRLAGVGYTKGGYHAPSNGQIPMVKRHHPADAYGSWRLMYPYNPGYQPFRVSNPNLSSLPTTSLNGVPTPAPRPPETLEPEETIPLEPPPEWLKKYLDGQKSDEARSSELPSPSARPGTSPLPNRKSPLRSDNEVESSPSDRLLENETVPNEEDDDLLLLDPDDFSFAPRPGVLEPAHAAANRYRQVSSPRMIRQPHFAPVPKQ